MRMRPVRGLVFGVLCALVIPFGPAHAAPTLVPDSAHDLPRPSAVRAFQIPSAILGQRRQIFVSLPPSFARTGPGRSYPVMIVLDGEANTATAAQVTEALAANGQVPECVIVGIANRHGTNAEESARLRVNDLTPPGLSISGSSEHENGDRFLDFIEQELLPEIDRNFRGGAPRIMVGHSSGGILATWAAATRPAFRGVLAIDTPTAFGDEWLPKRLIERAGGHDTAALRYASYEARFGWRDETWNALTTAAPHWQLDREHLDRESHETMATLSIYLGLRELFRDYSALSVPPVAGLVLAHYDSIGVSLGGTVVPPRTTLQKTIQDLLGEGRGADARRVYQQLVNGYGSPADSASQLARIAEVEKRPPPAETVEQLLATPFPTPDEARAFLGEWTGHVWMPPDEPRDAVVTLRIRTENGKVVGETVTPDAPPQHRIRRFEYLKVTKRGITWGFMNGMRPRGVAMFEAVAQGDTLSGRSRFGGIDFKMDDGSPPPSLHFEFVRKR